MTYRIVIDQSTSGTKALLFDTENGLTLIKRLDKPHQQSYPRQGFVEHDPLEIAENVEALLDELLQLYPEVQSISITNQRESVLVWNRKTGRLYSQVMVWQCNRGLSICQDLQQAGYEDMIEKKTGLRLDPYFSASKLKWFFKQASFSEEDKKNLAIGTIDTWLVWNLTQGEKYLTEPSNACRTLLYDIYQQGWDKELCELFQVPIEQLPQVIESNGDFGSYRGIPIVSVVADSQAALFGHGCSQFGEAKMTLGTGSSLLLNLGKDCPELEQSGLLTTIAWRRDGQVTYALEGLIKSYGDVLNWTRDQLGLFDSYQQGADLAFKLSSNEGVYFVPALEGLTAPFWQPDVHASFVGLSRRSNFIHLIRAAFESMCYQTRAVLDDYKKAGYAISEIHVDGGSVKNAAFMQLLADITQTKLLVGNFEELSALGALLTMKDAPFYQAEVSKVYLPQKSYETDYFTWKRLIC